MGTGFSVVVKFYRWCRRSLNLDLEGAFARKICLEELADLVIGERVNAVHGSVIETHR